MRETKNFLRRLVVGAVFIFSYGLTYTISHSLVAGLIVGFVLGVIAHTVIPYTPSDLEKAEMMRAIKRSRAVTAAAREYDEQGQK